MLNWTRKALAEAQADEDAPQRERVLAQVLAQQGGLLDRLGRYDQAKALLEESLATFDRLGLHREKAFSFHHLGYIAFMRGEYPAAKKHLEEGLAIYREAEDRWGIASSLNVLGDVVIALGTYAEAKQLFQESLTITEALGAREGIGWACHGLGDVHRLLGEYPTAQQYYQRSLTIFEAINAREGIAWSRHSLGDLAIARQAYLEAKQYYEQSLAIFEEIGDRGGAAETLNALGNTACALADEAYPQARETFHRALQVAMEVQVIPVVLNILVGLATILMKEAELEPDSEVGRERALELLTLVLDHPASDHETKDRATCLIAELAGQLPPAVVEAARIRAKARTLEEVTRETLK